MSYYRVCPFCGCHLDPCEICECQNIEKAAVSAANTNGGKWENEFIESFFHCNTNNGGCQS